MNEIIYEKVKDSDGVDCYIKRGEIVRCRDCKHFELDHFDMIGGIPLITAHEICIKWSGGSKTSKDGFCFMGERKNNDDDDTDYCLSGEESEVEE